MKDHYINILLFALPLNILLTLYHAHNQRNHYTTPSHTHTNRSLCECELYAPVNYDNDPQIKEVMDTFNKQTQQRFHEYDERMKTTRQKCKEQCDKEIQKIILKDKLEKQMAQQLSTLETKIDTDDIPTCVCEKSIADKVEKGCLRCGGVLGGGVMPGMGLIDGSLLGAISVLQPLEIAAAKEAALAEATEAAIEAGMKAVITKIEGLSQSFTKVQGVLDLTPIVTRSTFKNGPALVETAENLFGDACKVPGTTSDSIFCNNAIYYGSGEYYVGSFGEVGRSTFEETLASQKVLLEAEKVGAIEATYGGYHISIIASIVAIVVIVLIMIIIYLVLRYRRKKKMKKKLQYIKLLEE
ncbi:rifin PIR protein, putative [Plasmodium reichenowi]|uniref:Rifin PIR protein, putative n=1 Tax=Plasmodium reichenowi TaxID=5854 RepID=A0A2P9D1D4_PLARE|nr:rifin PIR protein, putative [Plasmodium reichenowi]